MRVKIYIVAEKWSARGWDYRLVDENSYDPYETNSAQKLTSLLITELELPNPTDAQLIDISTEYVEQLKDDLAESTKEAQARIKEYESKFLMLRGPEYDSEPLDIDGAHDMAREIEDMDDPERHPI